MIRDGRYCLSKTIRYRSILSKYRRYRYYLLSHAPRHILNTIFLPIHGVFFFKLLKLQPEEDGELDSCSETTLYRQFSVDKFLMFNNLIS